MLSVPCEVRSGGSPQHQMNAKKKKYPVCYCIVYDSVRHLPTTTVPFFFSSFFFHSIPVLDEIDERGCQMVTSNFWSALFDVASLRMTLTSMKGLVAKNCNVLLAMLRFLKGKKAYII